MRIRIEYDKNGCIGAAACAAVDPKLWILDESNKADMAGHKKEGELQVLELDVPDDATKERIVDSAKVCPVTVIKVINKDTGEVLAP